MRIIFALLLLATATVAANAEERLYSIEELLTLSDDSLMRSFDAVTMRMYHHRCRCYVYLRGDKIEHTELPVDNETRLMLLHDILTGNIIPLLGDAQPY